MSKQCKLDFFAFQVRSAAETRYIWCMLMPLLVCPRSQNRWCPQFAYKGHIKALWVAEHNSVINDRYVWEPLIVGRLLQCNLQRRGHLIHVNDLQLQGLPKELNEDVLEIAADHPHRPVVHAYMHCRADVRAFHPERHQLTNLWAKLVFDHIIKLGTFIAFPQNPRLLLIAVRFQAPICVGCTIYFSNNAESVISSRIASSATSALNFGAWFFLFVILDHLSHPLIYLN